MKAKGFGKGNDQVGLLPGSVAIGPLNGMPCPVP